MAKIVYLLGAGASANSVPIVKGIPASLVHWEHVLKNKEFALDESSSFKDIDKDNTLNQTFSKADLQKELINDLIWLRENCERHASIDTFAKKLFLCNEEDDYQKVKTILTVYFSLIQLDSWNYDKRYDTFFANILTPSLAIPENIKILSWNYDYQLEIAYNQYRKNIDFSSMDYYLSIKKPEIMDTNSSWSVFKINGTAELIKRNRAQKIANPQQNVMKIEAIENVVHNYAKLKYQNPYYSGLRFAWETSEGEKTFIDIAHSIEDATTLVVIGYSFPFFNRIVDRSLIGNLLNLKNIYIQDTMPNQVYIRLQAIVPHLKQLNVQLVENVDQFILPDEL